MKTSIQFGAQILQQIARQIPQEIRKAESENIASAKDKAIALSSGTIKTKILRKMGHPFAVRDPQTPLDPSMINDQGNIFRSSWQTEGPEIRFGASVSRLTNIASYSKFMLGTKKMIPRPIIDRIAAQLQPERKERVEEALRRALKPRK